MVIYKIKNEGIPGADVLLNKAGRVKIFIS
jgi:hypothetical protein